MALITPVCIQYKTVKYNLEHLTNIGKESYIRPLAKQLKINLPHKSKILEYNITLQNTFEGHISFNDIPSNKWLNA